MIVVDTSALMAIALDEPPADDCIEILESEAAPLISAATVAEALIVARERGVDAPMRKVVDMFGFNIRAVTAADARRVAAAHACWGKGVHPAGLNFGDCFAYALAKQENCPLLFLGNDFARTDIRNALAEKRGGL